MLEVHVISNGDVFREVFNAVAVLAGSDTFSSMMRISVTFAVGGVFFQYTKSRDLKTFGVWFITYFMAVNMLLVPKSSVEIIDATNPGAVYQVDNVPVGIAVPASLITTLSHSMEQVIEEVFHAPDDLSYSKTGLIFGSEVFRLSSAFNVVDPAVKIHLDDYVKNCVMGDILINNKYSLNDLYQSTDIWSLISQKPSPIRGLYYNGEFQTCQAVTPQIKQELTTDNQNALVFYGKRLFGGLSTAQQKAHILSSLKSSYDFYSDVTESATQIMLQNVLINSMEDGISNYAAETGSTSALLNWSTTKSMSQMRTAWATSRNIVAYTLPLMQTTMLVALICLFPILVLLSIQPYFGLVSLKHYFYSLVWVESWPILYSAFNIVISYYIQHRTSGLSSGGLTLSNVNPLALEHSDMANMAGYLSTCIPFIAIGLVYGMAQAFNTAANYIGGMMHSSASSGAAEAVSGNISMNNVSANKHDINATNMHGMRTEQLSNGALVSQMANGDSVYNTSPAMSSLPISLRAGSTLSETFGRSAETSKQAATHDAKQFSESMSSAAAQLESYGASKGLQNSQNDNYSVNKNTTEDKALSNMYSIAQEYSQRNNVSFQDALSNLTSLSAGAKGDIGLSSPGISQFAGAKVGVGANAGVNWQREHRSATSSEHSDSQGDSNRLENQFRENLNAATSYGHSQQTGTSYSKGETFSHQLSAELRTAVNSAKTFTTDLSQSERYSAMSNYAASQSASIDQNFAQGFSDYVRRVDPSRAEGLLSNTNSSSIAALREQYAESYLSQYKNQFEQRFDSFSQNANPNQLYQQASGKIQAMDSSVQNGYSAGASHVGAAGAGMANGRALNSGVMKDTLEHQAGAELKMTEKEDIQEQRSQKMGEIQKSITRGDDQAKTGVGRSLWHNVMHGDLNQTGRENG